MSVPFHIFNQGSLVPNAVTGVSVSVDNIADKVRATWTAPTTGRYPYGFKVMFSNATTSGGTYSLFENTSSGPAQTTTLTAATTPAFSNWYSVGIYSSNIQNRLSPVTNGAAVQFGLAAKAATLGTIQTLTDGSVDVNWTSNVSLAQPTQQLVVRFSNAAASYDDNTNPIALTGANYNTGTAGNANGLAQLTFNTAYTIYVLTSNTINNTTYTSSAASSPITFGAFAFAAGGITNAATQSDGSITVSWTAYSGTVARPNGNTYIGVNGGQTSGLGASAATYNTGTAGNGSSIPQLTFNTTYEFFVQTSNALNGATPTSVSAGSAKFGAVPNPPASISATGGIGSLAITVTAPTTVTTARPVTGYIFSATGQTNVTKTGLSHTFTGLSTGTYNASVVAYNAIGNSTAVTQNSISVINIGAPTNVALTYNKISSSSDTLTLTWSAGTNNSTVDIYVDGTYTTNVSASTGTYSVSKSRSDGTQHSVYLIPKDGSGNSGPATSTWYWVSYTSNNNWTSPAGATLRFTLQGEAGKVNGGNGGSIRVLSPTIASSKTWYIALGVGGGIATNSSGRNGGGYSAISTNSGIQNKTAYDAGSTIIAGGGGGGGNNVGGTGGGSTGGSAPNVQSGGNGPGGGQGTARGGTGGTQDSGGSYGSGAGFLQGGSDAGDRNGDGGGGGGGYYGGGGGQTIYTTYYFSYWDGGCNNGFGCARVGADAGHWWGGAGGGGGSDYYPSGYSYSLIGSQAPTADPIVVAICWST